MIEWTLSAADAARIRFAFSPLWELVMSLIVLRAPAAHSLHVPWVREVLPRAARMDLDELFALVPIEGATADFLTPSPSTPLPSFEDELAALRATPPERAVADLAGVAGLPRSVTARIRHDPAAALDRLADALQGYWNVALADQWERIRTLLDADVRWRAQQMTTGGMAALFEDLHETVTWQADRVRAEDPHDYAGPLRGEGLLLVPSVMSWPRVRKMIEPYQPQLTYPARGIATLWEPGTPAGPQALAALIGSTRATILTALAEPTSTTVLARRLSLSPSAISQHLTVLRSAGLIVGSRSGHSILYRRTRAGDQLTASAA
jgi:DNA-binding transcriptional ArsR family regulator